MSIRSRRSVSPKSLRADSRVFRNLIGLAAIDVAVGK